MSDVRSEGKIHPAPVRKVLTVQTDLDRAFAVFTQRIGRWWPRTHSINRTPMTDVVIEPRVGGRWYERGEDGSECEWGKVLTWQPPTRLVLAWQLGPDWRYNVALVTEVELTFTSVGTRETRVKLEHRSLERFGAVAHEIRGRLDSPGGWGGVLAAFGRLAQSPSQDPPEAS